VGFRGQMNQLVDVLANGGLLNQLVRNWEGVEQGDCRLWRGKGNEAQPREKNWSLMALSSMFSSLPLSRKCV
jgi:hypothetical protein